MMFLLFLQNDYNVVFLYRFLTHKCEILTLENIVIRGLRADDSF